MASSRATDSCLELTPLCAQECSIRFAVWCLRVAKLSVEGSESARHRLQDVHDVLLRPDAAAALERCVRLLLESAPRELDIREFGLGSAYASAAELNVLAALGALQHGDAQCAAERLARVVTAPPAGALDAAAVWTAQIKEAGILLPRLEERPGAVTESRPMPAAGSRERFDPPRPRPSGPAHTTPPRR